MTNTSYSLSIIIPAKNESQSLNKLLNKIAMIYPHAEIILVNDGSTDNTAQIAQHYNIKTINHPYCMGNGAAIKSGVRSSTGEVLVFMDADGQHNPEDISRLLDKIEEGHDMAVGARDSLSQASLARFAANTLYNYFASFMVNHRVEDLTSGFRAVRSNKFKEFLHLLPNGFSYPTTITMAFFRAGYSVAYIPINASKRIGKSHISPIKDGFRFLLIIFKVGTLYSPLKLFFPIAMLHILLGLGYYAYTFYAESRISLATLFLLIAGITIFLIGLVSEQITALLYTKR